MSVAMVLVLIAAGLILIGVVVATWGIFAAPEPPRGAAPVEKPSLLDVILELLKKLFTYMFARTSPQWKRRAAYGVFLVLLGIAFLLSAGIATLAGGASDDDDGTGTDPTPTTSVSSSPSPS